MSSFLDSLEEIQTEHRNLLNIALNKKISKTDNNAKKSVTTLPALPTRGTNATNVDVSRGHESYLKSKGYLDAQGRPNEKYFKHIEDNTKAFNGKITKYELEILNKISQQGRNWENFIKENASISVYKKCISLKKAEYFDKNGLVNDYVKNLINVNHKNSISSKFSSHHVSLLNIIIENNNVINEKIYEKYGFKTKWADQEKKLKWMVENNILTKDFQLTDFGKNLRLSKIKPITLNEINERDLKIINWIKTNDDSKLRLISKISANSRIYRFQAAGLIDNKNNVTDKLNEIVKTIENNIKNDSRAVWVREKRRARYDDLNENELKLVQTLALETPFLSEKQIKNKFSIDEKSLTKLNQGVLNSKSIIINGEKINCYALNYGAREILKSAGINRHLRGRFQKDSHVYHDLMVYESIQDAKKLIQESGNEVSEIIHERAQFQAKISANDNKGICHADSVLRDKSGSETAVEYGNYSVKRMMHKINGFSQQNVLVYCDNHSLVNSYKKTYEKLVQSKKIQNKNVKFIYIPSIQM